VQLAYSKPEDARFFIPPNVHVIGAMNTADRSLALVDYALRRRFAFFDIDPGFEADQFTATLEAQGVAPTMVEAIRALACKLNAMICADPNLGEGYRIGHSYFCSSKVGLRDTEWLTRVLRYEIAPIIAEYWRDSPQQRDAALQFLEAIE